MSAFATLVRVYFVGTPIRRGMFVLGLCTYAAGTASLLAFPNWTLGSGMDTDMSLFVQGLLAALPWVSIIVLFLAGSLMPTVVGRLLCSRQLGILPHGRLILLGSIAAATGLLSLATAAHAVLAFVRYPIEIDLPQVFRRTLAVSVVQYGLMYLAIWIIGRLRGIWLLGGSLLLIVTITLPLRYVGAPDLPLGWPVYAGYAAWAAFCVLVLGGHRIRGPLHRGRRALVDRLGPAFTRTNGVAGREIELLLGVSRPWVIALGQIVPIGAAAFFLRLESVWLFYLVLFSAISGAVASYAARRSRCLWLRGGWTREALFRTVEGTYLRHSAHSLAVLVMLLVAVGMLQGYSTRTLAFGIPLIVLGSIASTYLGLIITRGLGWGEALLSTATMCLLMGTALSAADPAGAMWRTVALELACAALALAFRGMARRRWIGMDWMLCRSDGSGARGNA